MKNYEGNPHLCGELDKYLALKATPILNPCPKCGKAPKKSYDSIFFDPVRDKTVTIQCKPRFGKPHLKVEISGSDFFEAKSRAGEEWNRRAKNED